MSLIPEIIEPRAYEVVRDTIGYILKQELTAQKAKTSFAEQVKVFIERSTPMDTEERLYFNVLLDSGQYDSKTPESIQGKVMYFIDVYTTGKHVDQGNPGWKDSAFRLHKFVGMVIYIFSHQAYRTLGLPRGNIGNVMVEGFIVMDESAQSTNPGDIMYARIGRVSLGVSIMENQKLWTGVAFEGNDTVMTIEETDKGYQIITE